MKHAQIKELRKLIEARTRQREAALAEILTEQQNIRKTADTALINAKRVYSTDPKKTDPHNLLASAQFLDACFEEHDRADERAMDLEPAAEDARSTLRKSVAEEEAWTAMDRAAERRSRHALNAREESAREALMLLNASLRKTDKS
ncbi:MAG: hypothetical protein AAF850_03015 [Pseudomonadota bacterium]